MMKKILLLTATPLLFVTTLIGCKKENPTSIYTKNTTHNSTSKNLLRQPMPDPYEQILDSVGIIHNEGLDYAFNQIKEKELFKDLKDDSTEVMSLVIQLTTEYLNTRFAHIPYEYNSSFTDSIFTGIAGHLYEPNDYSSIYKQKMEEAMEYYDNAATPSDYKEFAIGFLETNIDSIPDDEQIAFKSAILVSYNSWEYWNENLDSWIEEYEQQTGGNVAAKPTVKSTGKSDIEGCVEGAIGGAMGGGLVGAMLGAPLGAIGNSLKHVIWASIW